MNRRSTTMRWLALGAALALHGALEAGAAEVEGSVIPEDAQAVRIDMDAAEICNEASSFPASGSTRLDAAGCISPMHRGAVLFWLNLPGGVFRESQLRTTSVVVGGSTSGASPLGVQILNHVIIAYAFDEAGVGIALIGDFAEFPPTPSFLEGEILGFVDYDVPFEITLHTTIDRHRIVVTQAGVEILASTLGKAVPHADPMNLMSYLNTNYATTSIDWAFAAVGLKGVKLPVNAGSDPGDTTIGGLSLVRSGNVIRVVAHSLP